MKTRSGFSIVECLIYCSLFCLLCVLIFDWVGACQISLARIHKKSEHLLDEYSAMDSFTHDAMGAPSDGDAWKKITDTQVIWQIHEEVIGWEWNGTSLYRITGIYRDDQWVNATKSLVSNSLKRVHFAIHKNSFGRIVKISGDFDGVVSDIKLRNRRIDAKK